MTVGEFVGTALVTFLIIIVLVIFILFVIRVNRRRVAMAAIDGMPTDHVSLYFGEYFPTIMRDFDLVTKSRFNEWSTSIDERIKAVSDNISTVQSFKKPFNQRVKGLEKRIGKLEKM